ncbi:MAG: hypothetical protein ABS81_32025 [Pseudonocardia sp. SCN 72-86]|nr:MAG: hypothetical protein ABS81_32025 [Pseudonocardia sp. SCN 72-86]
MAGRVPAATTATTTARPADETETRTPETAEAERRAGGRRRSRPRGVAAVVPAHTRRAAPPVEPETHDGEPEAPAEAPAEVPAEAEGATAEDETVVVDPGTSEGEPDEEPRTGSLLDRLPVATTRKATAVVAAVAVVLLAAAVFLGVSWWRTAHSAAAGNSALVDVATTAQVSQQLGDAVKKVYSFDYTRLDQNEKAARDVITPEFQADYDKLFEQVRALGTQQQAVVTATISQIAVREIHGDTAVAVVFVDQQATKAASTDGQTQAASAGRLTVTGKLVDGVWKIAGVQVL